MSYKMDPEADISGTCWVGDLEIAPSELVRALGAPHARLDAYKVSGLYSFVDGPRVFTVYDWKSTSLYQHGLPSPLAFWNSRSKLVLSIGSNGDEVDDFREWLLETVQKGLVGGKERGTLSRKAITAPNAVAVGPYSHAVEAGDMLYLSGQTPIDSATGELVAGVISTQAEQCFKNLFGVLNAAGLDSDSVVKVNVFLVDMADFAAMNAVYEKQFRQPYPARTTIGVASLPLGAKIEIELIARRG
jgi:2-iminobutanoate/2-iminopropanoate deaminase